MPVAVALWGVAALFAAAVLAVAIHRVALGRAPHLSHLPRRLPCHHGRRRLAAAGGSGRRRRPCSCPSACRGSARISAWMRSSAFFLVVVNLGGAGASLFAIGYGAHEKAPGRVLPFYPVFLGRHEPRRPGRRRLHLPGRLGVHVAVVLGAGDGAPPRSRQPQRRLHLHRHGELRHAHPAAWPSACLPAAPAAMPLPISGRPCRPCRALSSSLS